MNNIRSRAVEIIDVELICVCLLYTSQRLVEYAERHYQSMSGVVCQALDLLYEMCIRDSLQTGLNRLAAKIQSVLPPSI